MVLQPIPRRLIRWGLRQHLRQRQWFADVAKVRRDLDRLPDLLDEVDRLSARGVIGGDPLNAADFQIAPSIRMLLAMSNVGRLVADRPAAALARRVVPGYPEIPAALPAEWIPNSRPSS